VIDRRVVEPCIARGIADGRADEAAGDRAALLGDLVGVSEVRLSEVGDARRAEGQLPGADQRAIDGDGDVDAGVADIGVVEEVIDAIPEGIGIEQPAAKGNLYAKLVLLVALAMQRRERGVAALGIGEDRTRGGDQGGRLVEAAVKCGAV